LPRYPRFPCIAFRTLRRLCALPAQLVQFFIPDPPRLFLHRLTPRGCLMAFGRAGVNAVQQFPPEGFAAQTPVPFLISRFRFRVSGFGLSE
jgi:hypothetical protein